MKIRYWEASNVHVGTVRCSYDNGITDSAEISTVLISISSGGCAFLYEVDALKPSTLPRQTIFPDDFFVDGRRSLDFLCHWYGWIILTVTLPHFLLEPYNDTCTCIDSHTQ